MVGATVGSTIELLGTYILTIVQLFIELPPATLLLVRQNYTMRLIERHNPPIVSPDLLHDLHAMVCTTHHASLLLRCSHRAHKLVVMPQALPHAALQLC